MDEGVVHAFMPTSLSDTSPQRNRTRSAQHSGGQILFNYKVQERSEIQQLTRARVTLQHLSHQNAATVRAYRRYGSISKKSSIKEPRKHWGDALGNRAAASEMIPIPHALPCAEADVKFRGRSFGDQNGMDPSVEMESSDGICVAKQP